MAASRALILLLPLLIPPSTATAQQPDLGAASAQLQNFRGQAGKRLTLVCPPRATGQVYGTDVYTDDSAICPAAVHAGVITADKGGPVTVVIGEGQPRFAGSSRNGVTSQEFADWPGSFSFDRRAAPAQIGWGTTARGVQGYTGSLTVTCPEGGRVREVWGSGSYTSDSSICSAAVHAGVISLAKGGPVTIRMTEGRKAYEASGRNGVASRGYGSYESSFEVQPASPEVAAAPAPVANRATTMTPTQRGTSPATTTATAPSPTRTAAAPRGDGRTLPPAGPAPVIVSATGFKGVAGPKFSQLSWNSAPGAVGYGLTRYDPTTQQRITLRTAGGDTVFAQTGYTDTAVTPNRTYGYRLRTHFRDGDGELVTDPDTSQGVSVTPKDPNAPLALPANFKDSVTFQFTLTAPDPNRTSPQAGDTTITLSWPWRTGAAGYRISVNDFHGNSFLAGTNGAALDYYSLNTYGKNSSIAKYSAPYASTQLRWPQTLRRGTYLFCIYAVSPVDPATGKRVESRPGRLKLTNSTFSTGGKWQVEQVDSYPIGYSKCPDAPAIF